MAAIDKVSPRVRALVKHMMTSHRQGGEPSILLFSTPRSGSTWLCELLATQGRFKIVNEPFNLRQAVVREHLRLTEWEQLLDPLNRASIKSYLESFLHGGDRDLRFKREPPFSTFWHWRTDRIIFKILFAGENSMEWFRDVLDGRIVFLVRHPIPVSLSRQELPRLRSLLRPPYSDNFSDEQLAHARAVLERADPLQTGILDWCLKNAVPLRSRKAHWIVVSYEQLVLEPEIVIRHMARELALPDPGRMLHAVFEPSRATSKSSAESKRLLANRESVARNRDKLVTRWTEKVSRHQQREAFETLAVFGIDFYQRGDCLPARGELISERPAQADRPRASRIAG